MRRKQLFLSILMTGCMLLTACGAGAGEESSNSVVDSQVTQENSQTEMLTGMIQSIEGSTITLAVFNMSGGNMQERPEGGMPQGGMPQGQMPQGGEGAEMPQGGMPQGQMPQGGEGAEMPQGGMPQGGEGAEMPEGQMPQGGEGAEMPEGGMPQGGEGAEMPQGGMPQGQMPQGGEGAEMPEGGMPQGGEVPEMPQGQMPQGGEGQMAGGMMGGEMETTTILVTDKTVITDASGNAITISELEVSAMVTVEVDGEGTALSIAIFNATMENFGPGGVGQGAPSEYEALNEYTEDTTITAETIISTGVDENAVWITEGAEVSLNQVSVDRTSTDSTGGDDSSFYGIGAAVLVTDGTVNVTGSNIATDAAGGAGVFAYGSGVANVSDTTITTTKDTSGGIHVAGGGTLHASNLVIETNGESAAAIRSDRGGGNMTVDGGSYTSNGTGSPAVYCTANIVIDNATLTATGSEAVCIEGLNSLALTDCDLTGNMSDLSQNDCTWTVILYQSMSGDSEIGNSTFTMTGGTLTSKNGGLFYTTNTESTFYLSGVEITSAEDCEFFLKCTGNQNQRGWGKSGANGADCIFTAEAQKMNGDVIWDSISTLDFVMKNGSTLTGAFLQDETAAANGGDGYANLTVDATSTWVVTANSTLSTLNCQGTIVDANQNTVTIQGTDGTVFVKGTSPYTITVHSYNS